MSKPRYKINESLFRHKYLSEGLSGVEMAAFFHIGRSTVSRYLKEFGISERNVSETRKIKKWSPSDEQRRKLSELGRSQTGSNNPYWKGGFINGWGYKKIRVSGKYMFEHRHVMEQQLGRPLVRGEEVHHMSHDKLDNRVENLVVLSSSEHSKLHWDKSKRENQSQKIKEIRSERYWSTKRK